VGVAEANVLCMQCGLCCDGTFYGSVVVADADKARLERVGLRIVTDDQGATTMPQPCSALRGRLCDAYSERPTACADYQCSLRKSVTAGNTTLEEAFANVKKMRELLSVIRVAFDCPESMSIWERILAMEDPKTPEEAAAASKKYGDAITAVGELLALGRASFEPRFAGGGTR
jgi:Fe-S-cluster containining protein